MKSCFRIKQAVSLFFCLIVVSLLAITKHHKLFGYSLKSELKAETASNATQRYACLETEEQKSILLL